MTNILYPFLAQVSLTFFVWIWMYATRFYAMAKGGVRPQELEDLGGEHPKLKSASGPSDNLENLFELPVLFYVAAIVIRITAVEDSTFIGLAWSYVGLRALHSLVHCTCNHVMLRFTAYALSCVVLWVMWARLGLSLIGV